jgi:FkbM family methyltransferase
MKKLLKHLYQTLPFKKQVYLLIKQFGTPKKSIYKHLHFVDNINVNVGAEKRFKVRHYGFQVENSIFWNGIFNGWEKVSLSIWAELCESSEVIFDLGANTGVYSLLAKSINPKASVFAFEPVERVYDKLVANNNLNSYDIKCVKKAISNINGEATIYDKDTEHTYSVTVNSDTSTDKETSIPTTIETLRLDTFTESEHLSKIDLLKVDVETHEVEALEGFGTYLKAFEPTFIIEILNDEIAKGIEDLISGIDY